MGTSGEDLRAFITISHSIHLKTRNVSDKSYRQNQNIHFKFNNFPENSTFIIIIIIII
jgi:hypothetical protein